MEYSHLPCSAAVILLVALHLLCRPIHCQHDDERGLLDVLNDTRLDPILSHETYSPDELHENARCQPMDIPFCAKVDYNKTMLPNFFGHTNQQDINSEINIFEPLLLLGCSPDIRLFLCTVYAPICFDQINGSKPISLIPCRSLCESARQGCAHDLQKKFSTEWPATLQCDKFPVKSKSVICVGKDDDRISTNGLELAENQQSITITRELGFICPENFKVNSYSLHLNGKTYTNCAMPCDEVLLDKTGAQIVKTITGILAAVCLFSTLFTCVTFFVNTHRFKYPARPIIIIAFCQLVVATCFLLGFLTNNKISCNDPSEPPKSLPNLRMIRYITMGNKKGSCTLQFMALYFFQMSSMFWWLMMTISWYMIARLKWAPEAVSSVSRYFHLCSWTIPALLTIYLSVIGDIEGDPLTGTCYVSMFSPESISNFVIYPILICVATGCVFLFLGLKSLWDSRETLKREYGKQTDEHFKLVLRIGLFATLFIVFSAVLLYCHYYEQKNLNSWISAWLAKICKIREYSIPCPRNSNNHGPHYATFIIKYVATMAIGIISALFMLSEKTLTSYREVAELCNYRI